MTVSRSRRIACLLTLSLIAALEAGEEKAAPTGAAAKPAEAGLRDAVWSAIEARGDKAFGEAMARVRSRPDATPAAVEAAARRGTDFPADVPKGKIAVVEALPDDPRYGGGTLKMTREVPVSCEHVNYDSTYYLYVPTTYDPAKAHPMCVVFMGGNWDKSVADARAITLGYIKPWIAPAEKAGIIVIAPVCTRGWGNLGRSLTRTAMHDVQAVYNIDPDRTFCWGQSMGGHACWREGLYTPDDWCGIAPICGGYDRHAPELPRLGNLAVYQVWGEGDPHSAGLNKTNAFLAEKIKELGLNAVCVPRKGGHELFADEIPRIVEFFGKNPRNLYPRVVEGSGSVPWIDDVDQKQRWTGDYAWKKPMTWSRWYWTRLKDRFDDKKGANWTARIAGENRIEIRAENVKTLDLFLHDKMVNLDKPVTVTINGKEVFQGKVERSVQTLLEEVRASQDRCRIYYAKLTLKPEYNEPAAAPAPVPAK